MKKNSRRGKRSEGERIGIDLGNKLSRDAVVGAEGAVVEEGSFRNRAESISKHFGRWARGAGGAGSRRTVGLDRAGAGTE